MDALTETPPAKRPAGSAYTYFAGLGEVLAVVFVAGALAVLGAVFGAVFAAALGAAADLYAAGFAGVLAGAAGAVSALG